MAEKLKAPFPYFGGKSKVASLVWDRLGDVDNYIEPFAGSAAVLLARPTPPRIETLNDADCLVANFWRATRFDPEAVVEWCDWPVNEADLHAIHRWLVLGEEAAEFRRRMRTDPDYFDPKRAGRWCWGLRCWIGGGWCTNPEDYPEGLDGNDKRGPIGGSGERIPRLGERQAQGVHPHSCPADKDLQSKVRIAAHNKGSYGKGVHARGLSQQVPGNDAMGTCEQRRAWLLDWFSRLRDRLRTVRVCCGHWLRVCDSESVTTRLGVTGVFLDPPYSQESGRDMALYATDSGCVAHEVRAWCLERGSNPKMRIVLAGYEGEHNVLEEHGWQVVEWRAQGGYGNRSEKGKDNARKERLWCSPRCKNQKGLFDAL